MGEILEALQGIYDTITGDSYTWLQEIFAEALLWVAAGWVHMKIAAIKFFWGVASAMLDQLNISSLIDYYWGRLDSNLLGFLTRYKVPEALNMIMNSAIVSFIMRMF